MRRTALRLVIPVIVLAIAAGGCAPSPKPESVLGKDIAEVPSAKDAQSLVMTSPGSLQKSYAWTSSGTPFQLAVDETGKVVYLSTDAPSFATPENVRVGMSLKDALLLASHGLQKETGWGYYVTLPSGWCAALTRGETMTEQDLDQETPIKWLFRRK